MKTMQKALKPYKNDEKCLLRSLKTPGLQLVLQLAAAVLHAPHPWAEPALLRALPVALAHVAAERQPRVQRVTSRHRAAAERQICGHQRPLNATINIYKQLLNSMLIAYKRLAPRSSRAPTRSSARDTGAPRCAPRAGGAPRSAWPGSPPRHLRVSGDVHPFCADFGRMFMDFHGFSWIFMDF